MNTVIYFVEREMFESMKAYDVSVWSLKDVV